MGIGRQGGKRRPAEVAESWVEQFDLEGDEYGCVLHYSAPVGGSVVRRADRDQLRGLNSRTAVVPSGWLCRNPGPRKV